MRKLLALCLMWFCISVVPSALAEELHIGLGREEISIGSDFNGTDLTIFGSVENGLAKFGDTQHYDVVVELQGPSEMSEVRLKERVLGIWVNTKGRRVQAAPGSYSLSSTRPLDDIANAVTFRGLGIGMQSVPIAIENSDQEFAEAFKRLKTSKGLYVQNVGAIGFLSPVLFKARVEIPASVPIGDHIVRGYLFKDGALLDTAATEFTVSKSGFEAFTYNAAQNYGLYYGLVCVALAMFAAEAWPSPRACPASLTFQSM
ncbi:MAG: TIGR02186 family protein, partial [Pseudomonadota bacterium]